MLMWLSYPWKRAKSLLTSCYRFTWLQVALYDVRFGKDSVLDRVCKAIQLGVMIGFFFIGFNFSPGNSDDSYVDGFTTSMVLMASRLTLTIQYGMSFFFSHHYTAARMPFILIIGTLFVTAMVYLGVAFWYPTYTVNTTDKVYIVWYVLAGLELGITVCASIRWRTLGFKGTHIVERLSLLTLIIIGEGIIGLGEAIQTATNFDISISGYDGAFYGVVVAGTLLLYFLYQLYFDNVNEEHFGTIREQIWVVMHFPLHISFILFVEGSSQAIKWFRAWSQQNIFGDSFLTNEYWQNVVEANDTTAAEQWLSANNNTGFFQEQAQFFNETLGRAFESTSSVGNVTEWIETHQQVQDLLRTIANGSTIVSPQVSSHASCILTMSRRRSRSLQAQPWTSTRKACQLSLGLRALSCRRPPRLARAQTARQLRLRMMFSKPRTKPMSTYSILSCSISSSLGALLSLSWEFLLFYGTLRHLQYLQDQLHTNILFPL